MATQSNDAAEPDLGGAAAEDAKSEEAELDSLFGDNEEAAADEGTKEGTPMDVDALKTLVNQATVPVKDEAAAPPPAPAPTAPTETSLQRLS